MTASPLDDLPDESDLGRALASFGAKRVLVVGDVMLDRTVTGSVTRLSPEAPVPVLLAEEETSGLGGAGNVANQLRSYGASVSLVGVIGADDVGAEIRQLCAGAGIAARLITDPTRPTTLKSRYLANDDYVLRVDTERAEPVDDTLAGEVAAAIRAADRPDVIVVSDHDKGVLVAEVVAAVLDGADTWHAPVLVDPKTDDLTRYRGSTVIKANQRELEALAGRPIGPDPTEGFAAARERIVSATGCAGLVATLGGAGLVVADGERAPVWVPAMSTHAADVSGAGDTVIATMALALAAGLDLEGASRLANVAAGLAVSRRGVAVISLGELADQVCGSRRAHVHDLDELLGRVALWRLAGRAIVFTNGCFDLLHAGHLDLLRAAAGEGEVLVVGVDRDASVRELKGEARPIVPEQQRAALVGALADVDAVLLFHHSELASLIAAVRPDRLVKGADYELDEIVGRHEVESASGQVVRVPFGQEMSTTSIIDRIRTGAAGSDPAGPPEPA